MLHFVIMHNPLLTSMLWNLKYLILSACFCNLLDFCQLAIKNSSSVNIMVLQSSGCRGGINKIPGRDYFGDLQAQTSSLTHCLYF